jgi:hypothetical protein
MVVGATLLHPHPIAVRQLTLVYLLPVDLPNEFLINKCQRVDEKKINEIKLTHEIGIDIRTNTGVLLPLC